MFKPTQYEVKFMRIKQFVSPLFVLTLFSLGAFFIACGDDEEDSGSETTAGEAAAGETAAGETAAGETAAGETAAGAPEEETPWGVVCRESQECAAPTDFCVKQPGEEEGYCTYACTNNAQCTDLEAPSDWSCNTLDFAGCDDIPSNWCGPVQEILDFPGVLIECP